MFSVIYSSDYVFDSACASIGDSGSASASDIVSDSVSDGGSGAENLFLYLLSCHAMAT